MQTIYIPHPRPVFESPKPGLTSMQEAAVFKRMLLRKHPVLKQFLVYHTRHAIGIKLPNGTPLADIANIGKKCHKWDAQARRELAAITPIEVVVEDITQEAQEIS